MADPEIARIQAWTAVNGNTGFGDGHAPPPTDETFPIHERFPRQLVVEFSDDHTDLLLPRTTMYVRDAWPYAFTGGKIMGYGGKAGHHQGFIRGMPLGDPLDDRAFPQDIAPVENQAELEAARQEYLQKSGSGPQNPPEALGVDGYRFHDALHLTFMALTGYSAVARQLLGLRRWSVPEIARITDGPRAVLEEESMFNRLGMHRSYTTGLMLPSSLLYMESYEATMNLRKILPRGTELSMPQWRRAVRTGSTVLQLLNNTIGLKHPEDTAPDALPNEKRHHAFLYCNLDTQSVHFSTASGEAARQTPPIHPDDVVFWDGANQGVGLRRSADG